MGCSCKEYPVGYLSLLNGLLSVIAVIIIGYTGAAIGKLGDFHVFVENNALTITGGFGVLLFMVSLIGLGEWYGRKRFFCLSTSWGR